MSLKKYSTEQLIEEIEFRRYKKNNYPSNTYISNHCIEQFMEESGALKKIKSYRTICKMFKNAFEIQMKPKEKMYRLLNNKCKQAKYYKYNQWIFVVHGEVLVTMYKNKNNWFIEK